MLFKLLLLCLSISMVYPWYTCDDKDFCRKIRNKSNPKHHFKILHDSIKVGEYTVTANLLNTDTQKVLTFSITGLENGTFRIRVNDPKKQRHSVPEALDGEPKKNKIDVTVSEINFIVDNGAARANVNLSAFTINIYSKYLSITVNEAGTMEFNSEDGDESIAMGIRFPQMSRAYGIPEHGERLTLKTSKVGGRNPYRLYNLDYCCYNLEIPDSLYGAIPVIYGHGTKYTGGAFWLNSAQTFVDVSYDNDMVDAFFISESGSIDLFILPGPTLQDSVRQYAKLTGTAPLPQQFALGYHQSRWSYMNQTDIETVIDELDNNDYPVDVMWLDVDYTDGKKYFTWNYTAFPKPDEILSKLDKDGRKLVVIIDPHIKIETGYSVYDTALKNEYFVKYPNGSAFEGECWPGMSSYIDFTNPEAMNWYSSLYSYNNFPHSKPNLHIWNDMNEPSVFEVDEKTMSNDLMHYNNWTHGDIHNMYGFLQTKGTYEGLQKRSNYTERPFILTRSHFAGSQRYTAMWTGDNVASWEHLRISIPMCLTEGLAGISFCGADVGGFVDNPDEELFQRWYQLGTWLPFFRAHSAQDTIRREPYLYSKDVQARFRRAIKQRYAHLQTWYTLWFEHTRYGDPVIRPLTYHYSSDVNVLDTDTEFLVGKDILVAPVLSSGITNMNVYLPGGPSEMWYDTTLNLVYRGGQYSIPISMDTTPFYYRGGSIIAKKEISRKSSAYMKDDPYTIYVFLDKDDEAVGTIYVDDLTSYEYKNNKYHYYEFRYENEEFSFKKIDKNADFPNPIKIGDVYVYRLGKDLPEKNTIGDESTLTYRKNEENLIVQKLDVRKLKSDNTIKFY